MTPPTWVPRLWVSLTILCIEMLVTPAAGSILLDASQSRHLGGSSILGGHGPIQVLNSLLIA